MQIGKVREKSEAPTLVQVNMTASQQAFLEVRKGSSHVPFQKKKKTGKLSKEYGEDHL